MAKGLCYGSWLGGSRSCVTGRAGARPSHQDKNAPCGKMIAAGRVCYVSAFEKRCYVSAFEKRLCYAITENISHNDQRKSDKQESKPLLAFWKMQDGVGNMDNLEQQPAKPPKDAGFEFRDDKSNGTNKIDNYASNNTN